MAERQNVLWIFSELFHPDETSTSHYLSHIALGLAETQNVKVVSMMPANADSAIPSHEYFNGIEIFRHRLLPLNKNRLIQRVIKVFLVTGLFFWDALRNTRRGDIALLVTNPPAAPLALTPLFFLKGVKTVVRVDDVYPDALAAAGIAKREGILFRIGLGTNRLLYRIADRIIAHGRDMKAVILGRLAGNREKVVVITNWADVEEVSPADRSQNALLKRLGIEDRFVILVAGNIGRVQGVPTILEAATLLNHETKICFLFVGTGALEPFLRRELASRNLKNIIILPNQARCLQQEFLNACDVAMLSLARGMYGIGVPSRMYNYMAAGKPVIGVVDPESEPALVIKEENIGWVSPSGDPQALAATVLEAMRSKHLATMGRNALLAARSTYSRRQIVSQYLKLIEGLCPA